MEFRLLHFEGCPGWEETERNLDVVLAELGLGRGYEKKEGKRENPPLAYFYGPLNWVLTALGRRGYKRIVVKRENPPLAYFYGSPTIIFKKNVLYRWKDLFERDNPVIACRPYIYEGNTTPHIPEDMLRSRLKEVVHGS